MTDTRKLTRCAPRPAARRKPYARRSRLTFCVGCLLVGKSPRSAGQASVKGSQTAFEANGEPSSTSTFALSSNRTATNRPRHHSHTPHLGGDPIPCANRIPRPMPVSNYRCGLARTFCIAVICAEEPFPLAALSPRQACDNRLPSGVCCRSYAPYEPSNYCPSPQAQYSEPTADAGSPRYFLRS